MASCSGPWLVVMKCAECFDRPCCKTYLYRTFGYNNPPVEYEMVNCYNEIDCVIKSANIYAKKIIIREW